MNDRRGLADAVPNADGHGSGDHWIQPSLFDADGEGAVAEGDTQSERDRGPRVGRPVLILTRQEVETRRGRTLAHMRILEHHGLTGSGEYERLVDDLDDCDWLLGDR